MANAWDTIIVKSANQTVTNNVTPQNDTELFTSVVSGGFYWVEFHLLYSGNDTTGDYRARFTFAAASTALGIFTYPAATFTPTTTALNAAALFPSPDMICGCDLAASVRPVFMQFQFRASGGSGTLQWQFANSAAAAGSDSITIAGSTLRIKRLS